MKFNWGTGIALFYSLFMITMIYMVYQSTQHNRNLVVENYYEKDLTYQSHLNKLANSKLLKSDLKIIQNKQDEQLRFTFPKEMKSIKGEILFYRPSDNKQDFKSKISLNEDYEVLFPTEQMRKGTWRVKVNWEGDNKPFYKEVNIQI